MRLGAVLPQNEIGTDPGGIRAYAQALEELGYAHLLAYDHVLGADPAGHAGFSGPYTAADAFHEPFVLYAYLAAVTTRLELVPGVLVLPQRQTALVAKQAAELDVLAGARLRLGVGIGWNVVEYEALGMGFRDRARRFEEQIELLRRLWAEPVVSFEGRFHRVTAAGINPLPPRRSIPLWIGGSAEPALRRAARLADGFFPQRPLEGGWARTLELLGEWVREAGRDPARFGIEQRIGVGQGTPDDWRREVAQWRALGATHVSLVTAGAGLDGPDGHVERLAQAYDAVAELIA